MTFKTLLTAGLLTAALGAEAARAGERPQPENDFEAQAVSLAYIAEDLCGHHIDDDAVAGWIGGFVPESERPGFMYNVGALTVVYRQDAAGLTADGVETLCETITSALRPQGWIAPPPAPVALSRPYEFDFSHLSPELAENARAALEIVLAECPGFARWRDYFRADDVDLWIGENPDYAIDYPGAERPWMTHWRFHFMTVADRPEVRWWEGNRFGVFVSAGPAEITAYKSVGAEVCNLVYDDIAGGVKARPVSDLAALAPIPIPPPSPRPRPAASDDKPATGWDAID
ncbi:MAG: hypothetical protein WD969_07020 [Paracoccaceae bacterium]